MANLSSLLKEQDFTITVKTGDRLLSGTDANVKIILKDTKGNLTAEQRLNHIFRNNFERGQLDTFTVHTSTDFGNDISEIEFWRDNTGFSSDWYVDMVSVENMKTHETYVFPVYRWIKADYHYIIRQSDTSLPQFDPHWKQREMELKDKSILYEGEQKFPGGPLQVKKLPYDERFSFVYRWDILTKKVSMTTTNKLHVLLNGEKWKSLSEINSIYSDTYGTPKGSIGWDTDVHFGLQRISGVNPSLIELCKSLPENFGATEKTIEPLLEGQSLQHVIESNRLFKTDLKILQDLPMKSDRYKLPVPIALFFLNGKGQLVPIAIQLFQEKREDNPVFLPTDPPYTWIIAKMWYNLADASYHQSLTHLGFTHLLMEGVVLATNRQLSQTHPIYKLLVPHFMYLLAINTLGLEKLINVGGWVDGVMSIGIKGMYALIAKGISSWRLDKDGTVTEDLKRRGLLDANILPGYHFRDDALLLYDAIHNYVSKYVNLYYDHPSKIFDDHEIMNWGADLVKPKENGGCGMLGIPNNGKFSTTNDLTLTLTSIIYTCSVGHAASNFAQYDDYAFAPNYPMCLEGSPPTDKTPLTEDDILALLPSKSVILDTILVVKVLSDKDTNSLGDFECHCIFDPPAKEIINEFREDLKRISKTIKARNEAREWPYEWLDPDNIPNAISI